MFLIGVLGAILFATSNAALAYLVRKFLHGAFLVKNPDDPLGGAPRGRGAVHPAGHRRLCAELLSELGGAAGHQGPAARCVLALSAPAHGVSGQAAVRASALETDQQHRAGGGGGDRRGDIPDQRQPQHPGAAGHAVLHELASRGILHHCGAPHRVADENRQPQLSPLQRAHSKFHGRHHARRQGSHRCASPDQDFQRRGSSNRALRAGQRTQSRLEHEADPRQSDQQSGRAMHRLDRARQRALRGDTPGIFPPHAGRRFLRLSDRLDADSRRRCAAWST